MATKTLFPDPPEVSSPKPEASSEPKLQRPTKRLADDKPVIETENDILIAFNELSWIESKSSLATRLQNVELDLVRKKYLRHFQVDSHATAAEGEAAPQTLAARRCELEAAVCVYAEKHKKDLVTEQLKTHDFGVGTIAFKLSPLALMATAKETTKEPKPLDAALKKLLDEHQIPQTIEAKLKTKPEGVPRPLSDFLRVDFSWDARNIVAMVKDDLLKSKLLKPLGIKVERPDERIEVKLKA